MSLGFGSTACADVPGTADVEQVVRLISWHPTAVSRHESDPRKLNGTMLRKRANVLPD